MTSAEDRPLDSDGAGEMRARIESFDWASTPLGPMDRWPQSLKTALDICLTSRSPILLWWGPQLIELYNDAYRPVLGATKHPRALGAPGREIWPEIWDVIGPLLDSVMTCGESTWRENQLLFLDRNGYQEETYFTYGYSPIRDESGCVAGVFSSVLEQTDRVLNERRFRVLRDLAGLASLAKTSAEACARAADVLAHATADVPFALLYLLSDDERMARLAGHAGLAPGLPPSPTEIRLGAAGDDGWPLGDVIRSGTARLVDDLSARFPKLARPWAEAPRSALALPLRQSSLASGEPRVAGVLIAGVSVRRALDDAYRGFFDLAAGHIAASVANARAYEDERQRAEALAALDRAKTEFFSNVSHEFRTPLTLILGPAEDTLRDARVTGPYRERLAVIHRNAMRLLKLVNSLLDFSRIEAGRIEAAYERVAIGRLTADLASSFRAAIEKAGMRLEIDCEEPAGGAFIDVDMWEKLVLNLLSNAFKHTFEGRIGVTLRQVGDRVELRVSDTGVGIPRDHLPLIFDRFHRVTSSRSRTHEGTGIGLALVLDIVRLHGGTIDVTSTEGVGTTFVVHLPLGSSHLPKDRIGASRTRSSTSVGVGAVVDEAMRWLPSQNGGEAAETPTDVGSIERAQTAGARVLLADDNADMREYVERLLVASGWRVHAVTDGIAARDAAFADPPDLVLTDVMMPRLDGFSLLRELKADPRTRDVPVILLSARAGEEAKVEGLGAGADDYLVKPFSARELVARVDAQLALRSARQATERALREEAELARTIERIGSSVTSELSLERVVQTVTDEATRLTGAQLGSFFYNVIDAKGESYMLYTLSGVPREAFANFPMPRNTAVFGPTFHGVGVVRSDDIKKDPRYGKNPPYYGQPKGHPPVVSYLAVPVISRSGEVLGGVFFGHERQAVFTERHERLVRGIAAWAALAIDNARLYEAERTSRVRVETALADAETARVEVDRANRAKSDFLAAMSHELRTPLNAIQGHVQLLEMGVHGPISDVQRQSLERVQRSQQHLLSLINDVLNFAKLEAGRLEYDIESVELAPVVRDVLEMMQPQLAAKGLRSSAAVPAELMVRADRDKVHQILLNLLSNAVKFTERGGIQIEARSASGDASGSALVHLLVRDTGIGIPADKLEAVFDPFVQAHRSLTRTDAGTGLGLAISRDLARGMGGDLRVESVLDEGSTFTLSLPMARGRG